MDDVEKKAQRKMTEILKDIRFESMEEGKFYLHHALRLNVTTPILFNVLMHTLGLAEVPYGDIYGWRDLEYELFSNKYGIAAVRDYKNKKTEFVLRLPPPEKLLHDCVAVYFDKRYLCEPMHIQTEANLFEHKGDME